METTTTTTTTKFYLRFDVLQRIEHWVLVASFTTLAVTGLVQKFALFPLSPIIVRLLGGIESVRIIHRVAATVFLIEAIYHLISIGYKLYVEKKSASMLPGIKDFKTRFKRWLLILGWLKNGPKWGGITLLRRPSIGRWCGGWSSWR